MNQILLSLKTFMYVECQARMNRQGEPQMSFLESNWLKFFKSLHVGLQPTLDTMQLTADSQIKMDNPSAQGDQAETQSAEMRLGSKSI